MKAYANRQPWISHRRVVITDPFLASWDARLGVEPVSLLQFNSRLTPSMA